VNCLNLAKDYSIVPHYQPEMDKLIAEFVLNYRRPVLGIPERSGVVIESGRLRTVGFEPSYRFDEQGKSEV
jgi:hypothetical protein